MNGRQLAGLEDGCEQWEVFVVLAISPLSILLRNLLEPYLFLGSNFSQNAFQYGLKFIIDFAVIVLPVLLTMTYYAEDVVFALYIILEFIALILLLRLLKFFCTTKERPSITEILNTTLEKEHHPTTYLTYLRGMVLIFTGIAILAVDFSVFPRRYAKTGFYGHSLMDVGVSAFVYILGISNHLKTQRKGGEDGKKKRSPLTILTSSSALLLYLGVGRTVVLKAIGYGTSITEYGVHWNFFFTLFVVHLFSKIYNQRAHLLLAIVMAGIHQLLLSGGNEDWALSDDEPRDNLISANREGIVSLLGYISLYYFASAIGGHIMRIGNKVSDNLKCLVQLFFIAGACYILQLFAVAVFAAPSRRVANLAYLFSQLSVLTYSLWICLLVQTIIILGWATGIPYFGKGNNPWQGIQPCMLEDVNRAGLWFFLLCNVLTGTVNMTVDTYSTTDAEATVLLGIYMLISCVAARIFVIVRNRWRAGGQNIPYVIKK
ncbi:unnamed protein product, partial [Mesorhabditis spiculigera]